MKISVVVPALDEAGRIGRCLASVAGPPGPNETIVVDGGTSDATREIARARALVVDAPRGRARQMNAGAREASGDALLFLHADTVLGADAFRHLRRALADPAVVGSTFTLRFDADRPLLRAYAAFTRIGPRLFRYGDQGIFVHRSVFRALGGFADLPLMEDVDFLRRLRRGEGRPSSAAPSRPPRGGSSGAGSSGSRRSTRRWWRCTRRG